MLLDVVDLRSTWEFRGIHGEMWLLGWERMVDLTRPGAEETDGEESRQPRQEVGDGKVAAVSQKARMHVAVTEAMRDGQVLSEILDDEVESWA